MVAPSVYRRKIPEKYPEADKACDIRKDHADGRYDKVGTVAHFAFYILGEDFSVNT